MQPGGGSLDRQANGEAWAYGKIAFSGGDRQKKEVRRKKRQ